MIEWTHRALRVGGVEIELRCTRDGSLAALLQPWEGYRSAGGPPDVVLEYDAIEGWLGEQPEGRPYPGYACHARSASEYLLARRDSRGTIEIPPDPSSPVTGRFVGNAGKWAIEAALRITMSLALPRLGGLLVHSAGIASKDRALVFSGPSGAGKSTISTMLAGMSRYDRRLGDDLTIVRPEGDAWRAYATPFAGEVGPAPDGSAPLEALYFLIQSQRHHRERLERGDALRRLLRNVMAYVQERQAADRALVAAASFVAAVPCWVLEFAKDPGVARVLGVVLTPVT
jgi:hypothetical protein